MAFGARWFHRAILSGTFPNLMKDPPARPNSEVKTTTWSFSEAVGPGIAAVRHQWPALVLIQVGAVALVISYYRFPELRAIAQEEAGLKLRYGIWFAFLLGMLAGGVVPEAAKLLTGRLRRIDRAWILSTTYNALVYGVVGAQVDLFYRFQAFVFGSQHNLTTLVVKTSVDMGIFAPVVSIPTATLFYAWRRRANLFQGGFRRFYFGSIMPGLIPCWFFWTPVLFCTYAMPDDLQLCFSMLAEAAWSIVFVFIATQERSDGT